MLEPTFEVFPQGSEELTQQFTIRYQTVRQTNEKARDELTGLFENAKGIDVEIKDI